MTTKAGIYIRVSMEDQDPENQSASLEALCKARSWPIHNVYRDVITGKTLDRVALNDFMHDARVGKFQVAVFWAWDRLNRAGGEAAFHLMRNFQSWGTKWESLQEPFLSSASDPVLAELLLPIIAWVDKQERVRIGERTKAGMARIHALNPEISQGRHPNDCRCKKHRRGKTGGRHPNGCQCDWHRRKRRMRA